MGLVNRLSFLQVAAATHLVESLLHNLEICLELLPAAVGVDTILLGMCACVSLRVCKFVLCACNMEGPRNV